MIWYVRLLLITLEKVGTILKKNQVIFQLGVIYEFHAKFCCLRILVVLFLPIGIHG